MRIEERACFLLPNLPYAPNIADEEIWTWVQREGKRDFPWLLSGRYRVVFSGVGRGWKGVARRDRVESRALWKGTGRLKLDVLLAWLRHWKDAAQLSKSYRIVVLAATPESGLGPALRKVFRNGRIRLVVRVQGDTASKALLVHGSKLRYRLLQAVESFVLRHADLVIPMGEYTKTLALRRGACSQRVLVLPFPVQFAERARITPLSPEPCILFVGRLEKEKGVHVLLKAVGRLEQDGYRARVLIVGDGSYRASLEWQAKQIPLERAEFWGWVEGERLLEAYEKAWVLVLPSLWEEGLGMVLVEAGLMGRPVIGSSLGGIRDIIQDGVNGFLVPPGEPAPLADALRRILTDRERAMQMGLANRRVAEAYLQGREERVEEVRQAVLNLASA